MERNDRWWAAKFGDVRMAWNGMIRLHMQTPIIVRGPLAPPAPDIHNQPTNRFHPRTTVPQ